MRGRRLPVLRAAGMERAAGSARLRCASMPMAVPGRSGGWTGSGLHACDSCCALTAQPLTRLRCAPALVSCTRDVSDSLFPQQVRSAGCSEGPHSRRLATAVVAVSCLAGLHLLNHGIGGAAAACQCAACQSAPKAAASPPSPSALPARCKRSGRARQRIGWGAGIAHLPPPPPPHRRQLERSPLQRSQSRPLPPLCRPLHWLPSRVSCCVRRNHAARCGAPADGEAGG